MEEGEDSSKAHPAHNSQKTHVNQSDIYLHEVAVEEGSLWQDEVGTDAAGHSLLDSHQLFLGQVDARVETFKVTPAEGKHKPFIDSV